MKGHRFRIVGITVLLLAAFSIPLAVYALEEPIDGEPPTEELASEQTEAPAVGLTEEFEEAFAEELGEGLEEELPEEPGEESEAGLANDSGTVYIEESVPALTEAADNGPEEEISCSLSLEGDLNDTCPDQSYFLGIRITGLAAGKQAVVFVCASNPQLDSDTIPLLVEPVELTFTADGVQYITVTVGSAEGLCHAGTYEGTITASVTEWDMQEE